ncbi:MAG: 50S ribosomal protein L13 [Patescibacteria group bacterium]|jgi:large subunit ribosomal protein L13
MKIINRKTHTIDATDKAIGRLATEAVRLLSGKHKVEYVPYLDQGDIVVVKNLEKVKITGQKLTQKKYYHYSGYPGGMKTRTMGKIFVKNPQDVLHRAVYNMLPKNQLRRGMIKRLKFI